MSSRVVVLDASFMKRLTQTEAVYVYSIGLIGTTEFVIGLLLLMEYDKRQKDRDKEHGE